MVHYDPPMSAAQIPPPVCPKCGSHRTVIVGRSDEGQTLVLRCNACGARSEIALDEAYSGAEFGLSADSIPAEGDQSFALEDDNHAA
jgi:transcription elongation factor Elf1